jgi:hypothetical protein
MSVANLPPNIDYEYIAVLQANIPISYYCVQSGFNTMTVIQGLTSYTLTIPVGNYSFPTFATVLTTLLTALGFGTWKVTYADTNVQAQDGLLYYTSPVANVIFSFPSGSAINEQFGFPRGSTIQFSGTTQNSTNTCSYTPENLILIHSNEVDGNGDDVLQDVLSSNQSGFSSIQFQNADPCAYSKKLRTSRPTTITFALTDEYFQPLLMNGNETTITIILYKKPDIISWLREAMEHIKPKKLEIAQPMETDEQLEKPVDNE